ncbi:MAG: aldo/keto reductase [Propionibacteriaceae bacterium]|nr:aldo/keto reductase [Propionibacteriaceae bacterium]
MQRLATLKVSDVCLGGNVFGWTADAAASENILDAFTEGGGNFIDTADSYSVWVPSHVGGESERIIGNWLRSTSSSSEIVIATKCGKHPQHRGLRPANLRVSLDGSRRRLGVETIDLYFAHADDSSLPAEEWLGAFNEMISQGSIRHYGISNFSTERVREVCDLAQSNNLALPIAVQPEYSLVHRSEVESGLADVAAVYGLAIIPYYSLAGGFLTGKYARGENVLGQRAATVKKYANEASFATLDCVLELADKLDIEPATIALTWLRQQPGKIIPIASASEPEQVVGIVAAMTAKLTKPQLNRLTKASESL